MERPRVTKKKLTEICLALSGENQGLISSVQHGLYEEPSLANIYPFLDFKELFAFAASSWKARETNPSFKSSIDSLRLYDIFSNVLGIGMMWVNKYSNISTELNTVYDGLNPFEGKDLETRLSHVSRDTVLELKRELKEDVNEYVFDCQYYDKKRERGTNHKLEIMRFQLVYPRSGKIVPAFVKEVVNIVSQYPRDYHSVPKQRILF